MTIGAQIQAVVVGWQIYSLTHDPLALGLMGLAEALPFIRISLPAGHAAAQWNRRTISLLSLGAMFGCSVALLAFSVIRGVIAVGRTWPFYAVIFVSGIARAYVQPAR